VTIPEPPIVEVMGPVAICDGDTATLSVTAGFEDYLWAGGEADAEIIITQSGTYSVTVTDENGCTASASIVIGTSPPPVPENHWPGWILYG
jgi:hypothetical protein